MISESNEEVTYNSLIDTSYDVIRDEHETEGTRRCVRAEKSTNSKDIQRTLTVSLSQRQKLYEKAVTTALNQSKRICVQYVDL